MKETDKTEAERLAEAMNRLHATVKEAHKRCADLFSEEVAEEENAYSIESEGETIVEVLKKAEVSLSTACVCSENIASLDAGKSTFRGYLNRNRLGGVLNAITDL